MQINHPTDFVLYQNYPNPFNPETTIKYIIPQNSFVILKIYDLLGREIETLVNEDQNYGIHKVKWNGNHFPNGIYICKLQAGNFYDIKKLIYIK